MAGNLVVVSCDPGVNVGAAIHRVPANLLMRRGLVGSVSRLETKVLQWRNSSTTYNVDRFLAVARGAYEQLADEDDYYALAVEGFTLRMLSSDPSLLEPVRFNAVLDDRLKGTGQHVEYQTPSDAKTAITDQRLALWGLIDHSKGMGNHGRDAQRHGLLYLRRWASDVTVRMRSGWIPPGTIEDGSGSG